VRVVQAGRSRATDRLGSGVDRSGCCTLVLHSFRRDMPGALRACGSSWRRCRRGRASRLLFTAAELVEALYRALAGNSLGPVIETPLRNDVVICGEFGFARWMTPAPRTQDYERE
jgi:hypothetical protein